MMDVEVDLSALDADQLDQLAGWLEGAPLVGQAIAVALRHEAGGRRVGVADQVTVITLPLERDDGTPARARAWLTANQGLTAASVLLQRDDHLAEVSVVQQLLDGLDPVGEDPA